MFGRSIRKIGFSLRTRGPRGNGIRGIAKIGIIGVIGLQALALGGCGGTPYSESDSEGGGLITPPTGGGTPPLVGGFSPSYSFSFTDLTGTGGSDPVYETGTVQTDSLLKVKITAGAAGSVTTPGYEEFSAGYGCVSYEIDLISIVGSNEYKNGETVKTKVLKVPGGDNSLCPNAQESEVIDLSRRLGSQDGLRIRVKAPRNDYFCQAWWTYYQQCAYYYYPNYAAAKACADYEVGTYESACPATSFTGSPVPATSVSQLKAANKLHTATGDVEIQVNGAGL